MTIDYTARNLARRAQEDTDKLRRQVQNLSSAFEKAVDRITHLEKEVEQLKAELAPKTLDKSPRLPIPSRGNGDQA